MGVVADNLCWNACNVAYEQARRGLDKSSPMFVRRYPRTESNLFNIFIEDGGKRCWGFLMTFG